MTFNKNYIYEAIIEIDTKNKKNFAPMGIRYLGAKDRTKKFEIDVFKETKTAKLLTEMNKIKRNFTFACIFTSDINYFYECVTKNFSDEFRGIEKFPKVALKIEKIEDLGERLRVICLGEIKKDVERKIEKNLINRAKCLSLEALICYTKPISHNEKKERISEMLRIIKKVAPDSEYERTISDLLNFYLKVKE